MATDGFFVAAGEPLRLVVAAVVDEGFLETAEARAGIRGAIFDAERLDDVDHEVRARLLVSGNFHGAATFSGRRLPGLLRRREGLCYQARRACSGALQETAAADGLFRLRHGACPPFRISTDNDFADLDHGREIGVVGNVAHDFLRVWSESRLKCFH